MKKIISYLLPLAVFTALVGCQQNTASTKKTGSYTAARHNALGSHIPQPSSADNVNSTVDDSYMRDQDRLSNASGSIGRGAIGGGGGGGR